MRVCRSVSALVGLAVEAIEAVAFMFDFSDPADKLYGEAVAALGADGLAEKEAQEEVAEPGCSFQIPMKNGFPYAPPPAKPHVRKWCCGTVVPGPHAEGCALTPRNGSLVSSAASGAAPTVSGSPVEARAAQPWSGGRAGQPAPLTPRELADAAYAVRGFALTSPVPDGWEALADRLTALAAE